MQRRHLLLAGTGAALAAAPARAAAAEWRAATEYPAGSIPAEGLTTFARECAARGGPTVTILTDAPEGTRSAAMPQAVAAGRFAVGDAFAGALGELDSVFVLSSLPFLATSLDAATRLRDAAKPAYTRVLAAKGLTLLWTTPWPATGLWSRAPLAGPDSLRGLRVRAYDRAGAEALTRAGATAEVLSFAAVAERLAAGTLDAVLSSGDGGAGRRLWEYLPHFTTIGYAMPISVAFASEAALAALPPAERAGALEAAIATEAAQWRLIITRGEANFATMRVNNVTIADAPPALLESLRAAAAPAEAAWTASTGAEGAAILARFRA